MNKNTFLSFPPFSSFNYSETLFPWCLFENLNLHEDFHSWGGETVLSSNVPKILYYVVPHFLFNSLNFWLTLFASSDAKHLPRSLETCPRLRYPFLLQRAHSPGLFRNCPGLKELPLRIGAVGILCLFTAGRLRGRGHGIKAMPLSAHLDKFISISESLPWVCLCPLLLSYGLNSDFLC